ncbi:MAG TPA: sigma-70 family RNA polymerase sigma factor [Spirochaetota bacterium]|nr:sigma-70 family RNA polymerase sigma factor [Spirochaetota bacterium]HPJ38942.1 sigma-70 family RNA polymerase sigma factor [Spirochaetota bacterium]HPQ52596.1 sigma-70 family RNA polymerase sigma factor [Spirochaetota bacterium]
MEERKYVDEYVIKKVQQGNAELFEQIVKKYQNRIYGMGMMFFRNPDDASDYVQEVFIKTFNNIQSYRGQSKFYYWLVRVAYNHGINMVKGMKRADTLVDTLVTDWDLSPEESQLKKDIHSALQRAVEDLPEKYRICIDLYFFYGCPYHEITAMTGFPVNTVKSHVFRAKQLLRDALKGSVAEEYHEM